MKDHKVKTICSKCGKPFEHEDQLPLCPGCLFGIEDINGVHKAKYPSSLSGHRPSERPYGYGPSAAANGR